MGTFAWSFSFDNVREQRYGWADSEEWWSDANHLCVCRFHRQDLSLYVKRLTSGIISLRASSKNRHFASDYLLAGKNLRLQSDLCNFYQSLDMTRVLKKCLSSISLDKQWTHAQGLGQASKCDKENRQRHAWIYQSVLSSKWLFSTRGGRAPPHFYIVSSPFMKSTLWIVEDVWWRFRILLCTCKVMAKNVDLEFDLRKWWSKTKKCILVVISLPMGKNYVAWFYCRAWLGTVNSIKECGVMECWRSHIGNKM